MFGGKIFGKPLSPQQWFGMAIDNPHSFCLMNHPIFNNAQIGHKRQGVQPNWSFDYRKKQDLDFSTVRYNFYPHTRVIRRETTHSKLHLYYIPVGLFCIWIIVGEGEWKRAWESLNRLKYTALKTAFYTQLNWLNVVTWNPTLRPNETTTSPMGTICRGRLYNRPACIWDEGGLGGNGVGRNCNVGLHWR